MLRVRIILIIINKCYHNYYNMERFANISETELEEIIDQKDAPNTKKATTFARNLLTLRR